MAWQTGWQSSQASSTWTSDPWTVPNTEQGDSQRQDSEPWKWLGPTLQQEADLLIAAEAEILLQDTTVQIEEIQTEEKEPQVSADTLPAGTAEQPPPEPMEKAKSTALMRSAWR